MHPGRWEPFRTDNPSGAQWAVQRIAEHLKTEGLRLEDGVITRSTVAIHPSDGHAYAAMVWTPNEELDINYTVTLKDEPKEDSWVAHLRRR